MMSNCQVRFLGEGDTVTCASLPDFNLNRLKAIYLAFAEIVLLTKHKLQIDSFPGYDVKLTLK